MLSKFKSHLHEDWLYIGFSLGISQLELNTINKEQARSQDKCYSMLEKWLQVDISACYCKLIAAVVDEQNLEVAEYIKTSVETKIGIVDCISRNIFLPEILTLKYVLQFYQMCRPLLVQY